MTAAFSTNTGKRIRLSKITAESLTVAQRGCQHQLQRYAPPDHCLLHEGSDIAIQINTTVLLTTAFGST